jgi:hypothetical protein
MRTTVSIADELLAAAKERAHRSGQSLGSLVEAALRRELAASPSLGELPAVPVFRGGTGPRPGIDLNSNRALAEALDEGQPLEHRR